MNRFIEYLFGISVGILLGAIMWIVIMMAIVMTKTVFGM